MIATPAWPPRSLQRLYVDAPLGAGEPVSVEGGQAHYLASVLRMGAGDRLLLFNGITGEWLAEVVDAGRKRVTLVVQEPTRAQEAVPDLALAFAPIKKGRVDWLVGVEGHDARANLRRGRKGRAGEHRAAQIDDLDGLSRPGLAFDLLDRSREDPRVAAAQRLLAPGLDHDACGHGLSLVAACPGRAFYPARHAKQARFPSC